MLGYAAWWPGSFLADRSARGVWRVRGSQSIWQSMGSNRFRVSGFRSRTPGFRHGLGSARLRFKSWVSGWWLTTECHGAVPEGFVASVRSTKKKLSKPNCCKLRQENCNLHKTRSAANFVAFSRTHTLPRFRWPSVMAFRALALAALFQGVAGIELTEANWDAETAGKSVFIKFLAPW